MKIQSTASRGTSRALARKEAERVFRNMGAAASFVQQVANLPSALQAELDAKAPRDRQIAFRIAVAPCVESRQRLWLSVPMTWRDDVAATIGLNLGGVYGTLKPWCVAEHRMRMEVPDGFRAEVAYQARRVFDFRSQRDAKPQS